MLSLQSEVALNEKKQCFHKAGAAATEIYSL